MANPYLKLIPQLRVEIQKRVIEGAVFIPPSDLCRAFGLGHPNLTVVLREMVRIDASNNEPLWASFVAPKEASGGALKVGICGDWFFDTARRAGCQIGLKRSDFMHAQRDACRRLVAISVSRAGSPVKTQA